MAGGRSYTVPLYLRSVVLTGNVYELSTTQGAGTNSATIARYSAGGTTANRRLRPLFTNVSNLAPQAVGTAPANEGWRDAVAQDADNQIKIDAGTFTLRGVGRRSGQTLEVDQSARLYCILYRVSSSGVFGEEIGRNSRVDNWTTTSSARDFTITTAGQITMNPGDRLQVEFYIQTLTAGAEAAPAVATDLWFQVDQLGANPARMIAVPDYETQFAKGIAETAAAVDTVARSQILARALPESSPATDGLQRVYSASRAVAESAPASDAVVRVYGASRGLPETASATDAVARSLVMTRALAETSPAIDALVRQLIYGRALSETTPAADAIGRSLILSRALSESAPATDAIIRSLILARTMAENAPASDVLGRQVTSSRGLVESVQAVENLERLVNFNRTLSETAPATDALGRILILGRTFLESALATDAIERTVRYVRALEESLSAATTIVKKIFVIFDD